MGYTGVSPESAWTGLAVRTTLGNPSTRPGMSLPGRVTVSAGGLPVPVDEIRVGLLTQVESPSPDARRRLLQFCSAPAAGGFAVAAGQTRTVDFALPVPWETPVTVVDGKVPLNLRMALRTEVRVGSGLAQGPTVPVFVHPLPAQAGVLDALHTLAFTPRQVGLRYGRLPWAGQLLPFHQLLGYWVAPLYTGPITELEVTFVAGPEELEVVFWLDRRLALSGLTHASVSRFRVRHAGAGRQQWPALVDGWLRRALNHHGDVAAGGPSEPISEVMHVNRPPSEPERPGIGLEGIGGGSGEGGGGGT
ncbi:sporulation protein [Micromonosporaceae bacterium DT55]|uniref:sporulation protein n=1 Tax=Melissospora conviva TaxID=3388432 RepID=UPI003C208286